MNDELLTRRAREVYLESASSLDAATRTALAVSRRRALASSGAGNLGQGAWWPSGAVAAAVMLAAMLWISPRPGTEAYHASLDEAGLSELMALGQELGLGDEEPELYAWLGQP